MRKLINRGNRGTVSLLAAENCGSHNSDTRSLASVSTAIVATLLLVSISGHAVASDAWQSTESILRTAEKFIKSRYGQNDERMKPVGGHLDSRLQLPECADELQAFVRRGTRITSRTIVGVRCTGPKPWKVYVPVDVVVTESVLVSRKAMPKGHVMTADDVVVERRDISTYRSGYLSTIDELAEHRLKRQIQGGRVITPSMLVADIMVRRGQMVTLVVINDQMQIRMAGRALSDGVLNQRIRVENTNSQRVVEGIVRSPEQVEVLVR